MVRHQFHFFENLINKALSTDQDTLRAISALADKVLALEFIRINQVLYILPVPEGVRLLHDYEGDVSVTIRGSPSDLFFYFLSARNNNNKLTGTLEVMGDADLARDFQDIIRHIEIDWEEHLSYWIGDTPAHKVGNMLRRTFRFTAETVRTLELDISEYLLYEKEVVPDSMELKEFMSCVDGLRDDVERLKLRISRLSQTVETKT